MVESRSRRQWCAIQNKSWWWLSRGGSIQTDGSSRIWCRWPSQQSGGRYACIQGWLCADCCLWWGLAEAHCWERWLGYEDHSSWSHSTVTLERSRDEQGWVKFSVDSKVVSWWSLVGSVESRIWVTLIWKHHTYIVKPGRMVLPYHGETVLWYRLTMYQKNHRHITTVKIYLWSKQPWLAIPCYVPPSPEISPSNFFGVNT